MTSHVSTELRATPPHKLLVWCAKGFAVNISFRDRLKVMVGIRVKSNVLLNIFTSGVYTTLSMEGLP